MIVTAHLRDGRTRIQFTARGELVSLMTRKINADALRQAGEEALSRPPQRCWIKRNPEDRTWEEARLSYLNPTSISWLEAQPDDVAPRAQAITEERRAKFGRSKPEPTPEPVAIEVGA